jgi:DNA-directed RNA polymerase specialized sigma24 family protein
VRKPEAMEPIDFHRVPDSHAVMHARLENWAAYVRVRSPSWSAPMWRFTRSSARVRAAANPTQVIDQQDGAKIERAVARLPSWHREALRWYYVFEGPPARMSRMLGVGYDTLMRLVIDGRLMLSHYLAEPLAPYAIKATNGCITVL